MATMLRGTRKKPWRVLEQVLEAGRVLRDVSMHARRTEVMVVSFSNPHTLKWVIQEDGDGQAGFLQRDDYGSAKDWMQNLTVSESLFLLPVLQHGDAIPPMLLTYQLPLLRSDCRLGRPHTSPLQRISWPLVLRLVLLHYESLGSKRMMYRTGLWW